MRKFLLSIAVFAMYTAGAFAQTAAAKPYQMVQIMMIKPKQGEEKAFEDAVKAHDSKYHSGAYAAQLWVINYGKGSDGWYIWRMGPLMYADMDKQPQGGKEHDDDWAKNVNPHVQQYGETNLWKIQDELSYTPANYNPENLDVWVVDIKPGMRYQFADLMKKFKIMFDTKKYPYSMRVSYNDLFSGDGVDAGIVFSFNHFAEFDDPNSDWRKDYESINGPGSWDNFWKEWNSCVNSTSEHIRSLVK
jgi:hypothetical protein